MLTGYKVAFSIFILLSTEEMRRRMQQGTSGFVFRKEEVVLTIFAVAVSSSRFWAYRRSVMKSQNHPKGKMIISYQRMNGWHNGSYLICSFSRIESKWPRHIYLLCVSDGRSRTDVHFQFISHSEQLAEHSQISQFLEQTVFLCSSVKFLF